MTISKFRKRCRLCHYNSNNHCNRFGTQINDLYDTVTMQSNLYLTTTNQKVCAGFLPDNIAVQFKKSCDTCAYIGGSIKNIRHRCNLYNDNLDNLIRSRIINRRNKHICSVLNYKDVACQEYIEATEQTLINKTW